MYNNGIMEYDGNNIMVYHHLVGGFKYLFICFQHAKGMMGWRWQISLSDVLKSPTRSWWANGVQDVSKCIGKVQHPVEKKYLFQFISPWTLRYIFGESLHVQTLLRRIGANALWKDVAPYIGWLGWTQVASSSPFTIDTSTIKPKSCRS